VDVARIEVRIMLNRRFILACTLLVFVMGAVSPEDAFSLTTKKEEELADEFMESVRRQFMFIRDPLITDYVNRVGQKILAAMPPQPFTYRFYVVAEDSFNAFAGPAGLIFVHSGLFAAMESEEELAGLLSHEIAHVSNRHIAGSIARSTVLSVATLAGLTAAILSGVGGVEALVVGMAGMQSYALAHSREDEMEADESGLRYLRAAGYSGKGLVTMLRRMRSKSWLGPNDVPTYLMTHPAVDERLVYLGSVVGDSPVPAAPTREAKHTDFDWANAKTIAIYGDVKSALRRFGSAVREHPGDPLAHYGYGLILARTGDRRSAAGQFRLALRKRALDPNILTDLGRIQLLDGHYEEASRVLRGVVDLAPGNSSTRLLLGRCLLEMGMYPEALSSLEAVSERNDEFVEVYYYLGEAYGKQGQLGKSHYNLGIYYNKVRRPKTAVFHLKRALENTDDPDEKRDIEEMIDGIRKKQRKARREGDSSGENDESWVPPRRLGSIDP